ncbi:DUF2752 domain-containing protein [Pedobacter changchengzhani]|uniref:DUF2752 domain-containing protein n=1 Tax=Pedobacter changchengzhani TaxID=2529274 RepID=A0A4R5MMY7_9SPHI|nr:DUF2752 domain-containing protein [Pedobacter changchengzhani]TDG37187.1 DUF2752 domain-containing protein [Pedobacter changchengzhani]
MNWLQNYLIPCPFKALTGIDCPGCGFQRSFLALLQGNFTQSWHLYPPTLPILLLFVITGFLIQFKVKNRSKIINLLAIIVGNFVLISYLVKML